MIVVCALVVGAVAASPAAATFAAPFDLSAAGQNASSPQVAVDGDGDAIFTWTRFDGAHYRVQARARSAAGALSAVQTLSASGQDATDPEVAVDTDGDAVFTWRRFDGAHYRIQARARSAAGALSAVQTLSSSPEGQPVQDALFNPQVAVDGDGDAVFTWRRLDGANVRVDARARSAGGALSAVQTLSAAGQDLADSTPQVAVDANGNAIFTWSRSDGANYRIQARARSAAGALSTVQDLSASGQNAFEPQVAVDTGGNAAFTWSRSDGAHYRVQTRTRSAAGALSTVQTLSTAGQGFAGDAFSPQVAVDDGGNAVFTWFRNNVTDWRVQARARSTGGALSTVQDLSAAGQSAFYPQVGVDTGGDAVFAWMRTDHPNVRVIQARERTAAGALFAVQTLSDAEQDAAAAVPQVAVDAGGDATVTWARFDGANNRIQAAIGP